MLAGWIRDPRTIQGIKEEETQLLQRLNSFETSLKESCQMLFDK